MFPLYLDNIIKSLIVQLVDILSIFNGDIQDSNPLSPLYHQIYQKMAHFTSIEGVFQSFSYWFTHYVRYRPSKTINWSLILFATLKISSTALTPPQFEFLITLILEQA